jgi:TRAP-type mannitol/chloroaromatic compound transport system permease small subunit
VRKFILAVERISTWSGKLFAWLVIVLMLVVSVEVFKRYILSAPTAWIFDLDAMLYGSLFMLCGAYALAHDAHVRGDFLYGRWRPRTQAWLDLVLYILFFLAGIMALIKAGIDFASISWKIGERSNVTADGPPVYHFKSVIPIAGALVMLQGLAGDGALRDLHPHRRVAGAHPGRGGDRRGGRAARAQRVRRTRNRAARPPRR